MDTCVALMIFWGESQGAAFIAFDPDE